MKKVEPLIKPFIQHIACADDEHGEIVVLPVEDMIRIRTGEHLAHAA